MITSFTNPKIKTYAKLIQKKYRRLENLFIVEGHHLVKEALDAGIVKEVLTSDEKLEGTLIGPHIIKRLSTTENPQPIIAVCRMIRPKPIGNRVIALNNVQDPGNVGTIIRSAKAFGFDTVIVQGVDLYNPKLIRSAQGALFTMNVIQTKDVTEYFDGYDVVGALLDKEAKTYSDYKPAEKVMLVVGNEGNGIEKAVIEKLNEKVYIPIEFESLNVAVAAAILMNEINK